VEVSTSAVQCLQVGDEKQNTLKTLIGDISLETVEVEDIFQYNL